MHQPTSTSHGSVCRLQPLGLLSIRGPDSVRFLQGQLSNDVAPLTAAVTHEEVPALLRAGLHNPQGRTLALLGLLTAGGEGVLAVLPRELVGVTRATLQRYVLRSKVTLADESEAWGIFGLMPGAAAPPAAATDRDDLCVRYADERRLLLRRAAAAPPTGETLSYATWHAADVAAGLPQVYAATSGQFVAQMLNLDCIGAISFTKGCYTGQEVIARAHYRGRVKRRMQRFISAGPLQLCAGDSGALPAGGSFRVVDSVQHPDGRCEFLAVCAPAHASGEAAAGGSHSAHGGDGGDGASGGTAVIDATPLPLPYPLPD